MEFCNQILISYGPYIASLLLVAFLAILDHRDTVLGRILLLLVGAVFLLTMTLGIKLSL